MYFFCNLIWSCGNGFLRLSSNCNSMTYCGEKGATGEYVFETCTNTLDIQYLASQVPNNEYRGFNFYYEGL